MIILIIDQNGVFTLKAEGRTPVSAYRDRPVSRQIAFQGMQPPSRRVHILGRANVVELLDNVLDRRAWRESPYEFSHAYLFPLAPRTLRVSMQVDL